MLTQTDNLVFERTVKVAPPEAFRAFVNPPALRDWLCDAAQVDARNGGRIYLWWANGYYTSGVFTDFTRNETLSFTWRGPGDPEETVVSVTFAPDGEGTAVTVAYEGIGTALEW